MSVAGPEDIKDGDCERGRVTQRPPILYAQFKYPKWLTEPDSVKVRLPKGNQYTCDLMRDASNTETYLKWFQTYLRVLGKKELKAPLDTATVERRKLLEDFKKFSKAPTPSVWGKNCIFGFFGWIKACGNFHEMVQVYRKR
jgi:hypothetical protein